MKTLMITFVKTQEVHHLEIESWDSITLSDVKDFFLEEGEINERNEIGFIHAGRILTDDFAAFRSHLPHSENYDCVAIFAFSTGANAKDGKVLPSSRITRAAPFSADLGDASPIEPEAVSNGVRDGNVSSSNGFPPDTIFHAGTGAEELICDKQSDIEVDELSSEAFALWAEKDMDGLLTGEGVSRDSASMEANLVAKDLNKRYCEAMKEAAKRMAEKQLGLQRNVSTDSTSSSNTADAPMPPPPAPTPAPVPAQAPARAPARLIPPPVRWLQWGMLAKLAIASIVMTFNRRMPAHRTVAIRGIAVLYYLYHVGALTYWMRLLGAYLQQRYLPPHEGLAGHGPEQANGGNNIVIGDGDGNAGAVAVRGALQQQGGGAPGMGRGLAQGGAIPAPAHVRAPAPAPMQAPAAPAAVGGIAGAGGGVGGNGGPAAERGAAVPPRRGRAYLIQQLLELSQNGARIPTAPGLLCDASALVMSFLFSLLPTWTPLNAQHQLMDHI